MNKSKKDKISKFLKEYNISLNEVLDLFETKFSIFELDFANLDLHRENRTLIPEIIFCENKKENQIFTIIKTHLKERELVIGTRCQEKTLKKIKSFYKNSVISEEGRAFFIGKPKEIIKFKAGLICAGTTDIPVCEEASIVLEGLGVPHEKFYDIGVAGIHRLFSKVDKIKQCDVLIVAAGMEGALPSVVGGLFHQPIIAIPTNIGYGTALNGFTALFAMLTSCSPGITVVNINNGVGAATAAYKILKFAENKVAENQNSSK